MAWASELLLLIRPSDVSRTLQLVQQRAGALLANGEPPVRRLATDRLLDREQFGDALERIFGDRRGGRLMDVVELAPRVAPAGDLDQPGLAGRWIGA